MGQDFQDNTKQVLAEMLLKALVALAKRNLADENSKLKKDGNLDCWPAGMKWNQMVGTSHSIFLDRARNEADIGDFIYKDIIRTNKDIDLDELWEKIC